MIVTWIVPLVVGIHLRGFGRGPGSIVDQRGVAGLFVKEIPEHDPPGLEILVSFLLLISVFCFLQSKTFSRWHKMHNERNDHSQVKSRVFPFSFVPHLVTPGNGKRCLAEGSCGYLSANRLLTAAAIGPIDDE